MLFNSWKCKRHKKKLTGLELPSVEKNLDDERGKKGGACAKDGLACFTVIVVAVDAQGTIVLSIDHDNKLE